MKLEAWMASKSGVSGERREEFTSFEGSSLGSASKIHLARPAEVERRLKVRAVEFSGHFGSFLRPDPTY